jgi:hypothetical protein
LRIFEAATISIALVILRVFWTLLILVRISFELGMDLSSLRVCRRGLPADSRRRCARSIGGEGVQEP